MLGVPDADWDCVPVSLGVGVIDRVPEVLGDAVTLGDCVTLDVCVCDCDAVVLWLIVPD